MEYELAFMNESDGSWDVVETFEAVDDDAANAWAEENEPRMRAEYNNTDWYILRDGENINQ